MCWSYLQFNQSESSTSSGATVVLDCRASNDGLEFVDRSGSDGGGLGQTSSPSSRFAAWLVEVHADPALPVLVEVVVGQLLVVFDRHCV
jgi:hypothetical protein